MTHDWYPLCSDINTHWSETYHWWRCANCKKETTHIKIRGEEKPSDDGCEAKKRDSIFPLSSN